jgi:hypothetical protein
MQRTEIGVEPMQCPHLREIDHAVAAHHERHRAGLGDARHKDLAEPSICRAAPMLPVFCATAVLLSKAAEPVLWISTPVQSSLPRTLAHKGMALRTILEVVARLRLQIPLLSVKELRRRVEAHTVRAANPCGLITEFFRALNDTHGTHHSLHDGLPC